MGCAHPFFDDLRLDPHQQLPNGRHLPPLFNFTDYERSIEPDIMPLLQPRPTTPTSNQPTRATEQAPSQQRNRHAAGEESPVSKQSSGTRPKTPETAGKRIPELSESPLSLHHFPDLGNGDHVAVGSSGPLGTFGLAEPHSPQSDPNDASAEDEDAADEQNSDDDDDDDGQFNSADSNTISDDMDDATEEDDLEDDEDGD